MSRKISTEKPTAHAMPSVTTSDTSRVIGEPERCVVRRGGAGIGPTRVGIWEGTGSGSVTGSGSLTGSATAWVPVDAGSVLTSGCTPMWAKGSSGSVVAGSACLTVSAAGRHSRGCDGCRGGEGAAGVGGGGAGAAQPYGSVSLLAGSAVSAVDPDSGSLGSSLDSGLGHQSGQSLLSSADPHMSRGVPHSRVIQ